MTMRGAKGTRHMGISRANLIPTHREIQERDSVSLSRKDIIFLALAEACSLVKREQVSGEFRSLSLIIRDIQQCMCAKIHFFYQIIPTLAASIAWRLAALDLRRFEYAELTLHERVFGRILPECRFIITMSRKFRARGTLPSRKTLRALARNFDRRTWRWHADSPTLGSPLEAGRPRGSDSLARRGIQKSLKIHVQFSESTRYSMYLYKGQRANINLIRPFGD